VNKDVDIYLIDLKGCEFPMFDKCKQVKSVSVSDKDALGVLLEIVEIMQTRYRLFKDKDVRDIQDYNKKNKKKLKYIVVMIDEFSELMENHECQRELERLSALSRSSGICLILSTQRPDCKVISSRIKCNVSVIAGLRTNTDINSRIIMDNDSLSKLKGRGHCMFRYKGKDVELQTIFISDEKISELIKPFKVYKKSNKSAEVENGNIINFDFLEDINNDNNYLLLILNF